MDTFRYIFHVDNNKRNVMKKKFFEYYNPSENEFEGLWKKCLFIFDTSVLINLYEFSPDVRDEFLDILKANSDRIWIPHQVAKEFQWRRPSVIREQRAIHQQLKKEFLETEKKFIENIEKSIRYHPFIDKKRLEEEIKKSFSNLVAYLKKCEDNYPDLIKNDIVREKIDSLFDGKVGPEFKESEIQGIYLEGAKRYAQKIPPGFADKDAKDNFKRYGDLILWRQIIRHSISSKKPVIFVTNDQKNDWWFTHFFQEKPTEKEILGPRPELIKEFFEETKHSFYMYNPSDFMGASRKYLKQKVSDSAIKEVQDVSKRQAKGYGQGVPRDYYIRLADSWNESHGIPSVLTVNGDVSRSVPSGSGFVISNDDRCSVRIAPGTRILSSDDDRCSVRIAPGTRILSSDDDRYSLRLEPGTRILSSDYEQDEMISSPFADAFRAAAKKVSTSNVDVELTVKKRPARKK